MEKAKYFILVAFFLIAKGPGKAQDTTNQLNKYLELATGNNPEIKAAYFEYLAAIEKIPQAGSLPDPQVTFGYFMKPMELLEGNQKANIELMQMLPWFGTLKSAKDEAAMMAKAKFGEYLTARAEIIYQVKLSWYRLLKYDREISLINSTIELLKSIEHVALINFQLSDAGVSASMLPGPGKMNNATGEPPGNSGGGMAGMQTTGNTNMAGNGVSVQNTRTTGMGESMTIKQTGLPEVLRVKMEILELMNRLALVTDQRKVGCSQFNSLLNRDLETMVDLSAPLEREYLPIEKLAMADSILKNNPMLDMLENETRAYISMEQKTKKMRMPMLGIGLNYMIIGESEGNSSMMNGKDMIMPMVSLSIPMYQKKYKAMQNEARYLQEGNKQQIISVKNNLLVQAQLSVMSLNDAERRIDLYKEQEALARTSVDLLLTRFSQMGSGYEELLNMQLKWIEYGFNRIAAIVDYNINLALADKLMNINIFK